MQSAAGFFDMFTIYLGDRLGYYHLLADDGPLTSSELASRSGTHERYAREWLEQQAATGLLEVTNPAAPALARRFYLPEGHDEVLADRDNLNYFAPMAQLVAGAVFPLSALVQAYRTGGGVRFEDYGPDLREGQARMNRAMFLKQLGQEWLPAMPDVHRRLQADHQARIADIGCGAGWSSIGMAKCFPRVRVDGFDSDQASIEMAKANASEEGLTSRVRFDVRDAADSEFAGRYHLVTAFECIHDMSQPVAALRTMRQLVHEDGAVLVMDERTHESFTPSVGGFEAFLYGCSVVHCLPAGMSEDPSACTGAVMRPDTMRRYALEAGYREVEILPIDHPMFRFYRLLL